MYKITFLLAMAALSGCASVAGEKLQPVFVTTLFGDKEVAGLGCTLTNDAGSWFLTSPASVRVRRSTGDLAIECKKGSLIGNASVASASNGPVWGNIVMGGGIGYIVDRNTGAGFDYPPSITVNLRKNPQLP